jgi:hypothetical protein
MPVFGRVMLAGLCGVMRGMVQVAFRNLSMVASLFMFAGLMMVSGGLVMFSCVFVVLRCFAMVLRGILGHVKTLLGKRFVVLGFRETGIKPTAG